MKAWIKIVYMVFAGLAVAVFIYPALHETGHALAALAVGGQVTKIRIFPVAFTECNVLQINSGGRIVISAAGAVFPFLFTPFSAKRFVIWYPVFVLRIICLMSFVISFICVILFLSGITVQNEDMVYAVSTCGGRPYAALCAAMLFAASAAFVIARDRPFSRFSNYLTD